MAAVQGYGSMNRLTSVQMTSSERELEKGFETKFSMRV
jgi:hypothetical protein